MSKIWNCGLSLEEALDLYEAYLLGRAPAKGAVAALGPSLYLLPEGVTGGAPVPGEDAVYTSADEAHTRGALRNFRDWRRLPRGTAVVRSSGGVRILTEEEWEEPAGKALFLLPSMLEEVLTDKEAAAQYGVSPRQVKADCERGLFSGEEAKPSGQGWLITKRAAAGKYGGEETAPYRMGPLLLVFTTLEAGHLWNRPGEDVRSAAAGAGHRAARLDPRTQCRRAGRTWLVTRSAMEELYGDPWTGRWGAWVRAQFGACKVSMQ